MIDGGAPLAGDGVAVGVGLGDDKQSLIDRIGDGGVDGCQPDLAEPSPVLERVAADEREPDLMVALGLGVELGEAAVGAVLGEYPIERAGRCPYCLAFRVAGSPRIERR